MNEQDTMLKNARDDFFRMFVWLFFITNALILFMFLLDDPSPIGIAVFAIWNGFLFYKLVWQNKQESENLLASAFEHTLLSIIVAEVFVVFVMREGLKDYFSSEYTFEIPSWSLYWIPFIIIGLLMYLLIGISSEKGAGPAALWIANEFLGAGLAIMYAPVFELTFLRYGVMFFLLYTVLNLIWCSIYSVARNAGNGQVLSKRWVFLLIAFVAILILLYSEHVSKQMYNLPSALDVFVHNYFFGIKGWIILAALILTAIAQWFYKEDGVGKTNLLLPGLIEMLILFKIIYTHPLPFGYIAIPILSIFLCKIQRAENEGKAVAPLLDSIGVTVVLALLILCISRGQWVVALAGLIGLDVLYVNRQKLEGKGIYIFLLIWIAVMAMIWSKYERASIEIMIVVAAVTVLMMAAMLLSVPVHPSIPNYLHFVRPICVVMLIVLTTAFFHGTGTDITFALTDENQKVSVNIETNGKDNSVSNAYYYWTGTGDNGYNEIKMGEGENTVDADGRFLHVMAWDKKGVITEKTYYYPRYYYQMDDQIK